MHKRSCSRIRSEEGFYLIETLVALLIGSIIVFTLLQLLSESMRVNSNGANRQAAALMTQTVLDSAKATNWYQGASPPFSWPPAAPPAGSGIPFSPVPVGRYELVTNPVEPNQLSAGHPLPVGLDLGDMTWANKIVNGDCFQGTVELDVTAGPDPTSVISTVVATWSDNQNATGKTISTMTLICQRGINYWPSP